MQKVVLGHVKIFVNELSVSLIFFVADFFCDQLHCICPPVLSLKVFLMVDDTFVTVPLRPGAAVAGHC